MELLTRRTVLKGAVRAIPVIVLPAKLIFPGQYPEEQSPDEFYDLHLATGDSIVLDRSTFKIPLDHWLVIGDYNKVSIDWTPRFQRITAITWTSVRANKRYIRL